MSKNSSRSNGGGNGGGGFPVFAAIMLGIVLGLMIAGGIALLIMKKTPVTLAPKEVREAPKPAPEPEKTPAPAGKPASKAAPHGEDKARFEFYKELTDKSDGSSGKKPAVKPTPPAVKQPPLQHTTPPVAPVAPSKPADSAAAKTTYFLQAGSFQNSDDAEKVKAKLAFIGMEANVQPATIPDKGVWYRVRLGPYHGADEMNAALNTLKQNGINAAPIRAQ
jgi:cell division protein FtsN